jgi:hypothetical protein
VELISDTLKGKTVTVLVKEDDFRRLDKEVRDADQSIGDDV